jgi:hypothetical protein
VDFFSSVFWSWHLRTVEILIPVPGIWAAPPTSIIGRSFFLAVISAPFCLDLPCARVFLRQDFSFPASTVRTPPVGRSAEHWFFHCFLCSGVWAGCFHLTGLLVLKRMGAGSHLLVILAPSVFLAPMCAAEREKDHIARLLSRIHSTFVVSVQLTREQVPSALTEGFVHRDSGSRSVCW